MRIICVFIFTNCHICFIYNQPLQHNSILPRIYRHYANFFGIIRNFFVVVTYYVLLLLNVCHNFIRTTTRNIQIFDRGTLILYSLHSDIAADTGVVKLCSSLYAAHFNTAPCISLTMDITHKPCLTSLTCINQVTTKLLEHL